MRCWRRHTTDHCWVILLATRDGRDEAQQAIAWLKEHPAVTGRTSFYADWQDLLGSENMNRVTLPIWGGGEFFRLVRP